MATGSRNTVLAVDDMGEWADEIALAVGELAPEVVVRRESTREAALLAIREAATTLLAVITDNSLEGSEGTHGVEIAQSALDAEVPHVAILTARPDSVRPPQGAEVWSKTARLKDLLRPFFV